MNKIPANIKARVQELVPGGVIERETVKKVKQINPARRIEIQIGDALQDDFFPQFKTLHWDNEVNFSARLVTKDGAITQHDGKLAYDDGEVIARFYEKDTGDEDGGFEFDVVLKRKPASNVLTWTIQHKELDFFYQPPLTLEEIEEGASRPENVVGSYAVYHKTKKNNRVGGKEYRTGKAFHIYRPYAEDANGERVWCDLNIDEQTNKMTVSVPQEFLDTAVYPVIVDPTFGYTSVGASSGTLADSSNDRSYTVGTSENLSVSGTLDSIHVALDSSDNDTETVDITAALFREDSAGSGSHDLVVGIERANLSVDGTEQFYTFTASSESLSADDYVLAAIGNGEDVTDGAIVLLYDSTSSRNLYSESTTGLGSYATRVAENPWTETATVSTNQRSIYVTYTAAATYTLTVTNASLTFSGQTINPLVNRSITVTTATLSLTGQTVTLRYNRILPVSAATLTLTGQTVNLTYGVAGCALLQETGDVILQETTDRLLLESCDDGGISYSIVVSPRVLDISPQSVTLVVSRRITVSTASLTITGNNVAFVVNRTITVTPATLTITGQSVTVTYTRILPVTGASLTITPNNVAFALSRAISVEPASLTITGQTVLLDYSGVTGNIKYWDGSTWDVRQLKYWNGSSWENATLKRFNGSTWDTINY